MSRQRSTWAKRQSRSMTAAAKAAGIPEQENEEGEEREEEKESGGTVASGDEIESDDLTATREGIPLHKNGSDENPAAVYEDSQQDTSKELDGNGKNKYNGWETEEHGATKGINIEEEDHAKEAVSAPRLKITVRRPKEMPDARSTPPPPLFVRKKKADVTEAKQSRTAKKSAKPGPSKLAPPEGLQLKANKKEVTKPSSTLDIPEVSESETEEENSTVPQENKMKSSKRKQDEVTLSEYIVFRVPQIAKGGILSIVNIEKYSPMDELLHDIYKVIGCSDVKKKPILSYTFGGHINKGMELSTLEHLQFLVHEVDNREKAHREAQVSIHITKEYTASLTARLAPKPVPAKGSTSSKRRTAKKGPQPMDLDGTDDDMNDPEIEDSAEDKELMHFKQLDSELRSCKKCGGERRCKLGFDGDHLSVSVNHVSVWAKALAMQTTGVTLRSMPKTELFADWHKSRSKAKNEHRRSRSRSASSYDGNRSKKHRSRADSYSPSPEHGHRSRRYYQQQPQIIYLPSAPLVPSLPSSSTTQPSSTSDTNDADDINLFFPSVNDFIEESNNNNPSRYIDPLIFKVADVFSLAELATITVPTLMDPPFSFTWGKANFLERQIKTTIQSIRKHHG